MQMLRCVTVVYYVGRGSNLKARKTKKFALRCWSEDSALRAMLV